MARGARKKDDSKGKKGHIGFEAELFLAADKLRKNLEPSGFNLLKISGDCHRPCDEKRLPN